MMGLSVAGDNKSEADLLNTVSDPTVYSARLKQLIDKSAEANTFLQQATAANVQMEASRKQVEAIKAETMNNLRTIAAKETELAVREVDYAAKAKQLADQTKALADEKAKFKTEQAKITEQQAKYAADNAAKLAAREAAVAVAEAETKKALDDAVVLKADLQNRIALIQKATAA